MSEPVYSTPEKPVVYRRATRVLWRAAADRVVLRHCGPCADRAANEISGWAALLWLALDRPRSLADLIGELERSGYAEPDTQLQVALSLLLDHWLIEECER